MYCECVLWDGAWLFISWLCPDEWRSNIFSVIVIGFCILRNICLNPGFKDVFFFWMFYRFRFYIWVCKFNIYIVSISVNFSVWCNTDVKTNVFQVYSQFQQLSLKRCLFPYWILYLLFKSVDCISIFVHGPFFLFDPYANIAIF